MREILCESVKKKKATHPLNSKHRPLQARLSVPSARWGQWPPPPPPPPFLQQNAGIHRRYHLFDQPPQWQQLVSLAPLPTLSPRHSKAHFLALSVPNLVARLDPPPMKGEVGDVAIAWERFFWGGGEGRGGEGGNGGFSMFVFFSKNFLLFTRACCWWDFVLEVTPFFPQGWVAFGSFTDKKHVCFVL